MGKFNPNVQFTALNKAMSSPVFQMWFLKFSSLTFNNYCLYNSLQYLLLMLNLVLLWNCQQVLDLIFSKVSFEDFEDCSVLFSLSFDYNIICLDWLFWWSEVNYDESEVRENYSGVDVEKNVCSNFFAGQQKNRKKLDLAKILQHTVSPFCII